MMQMKERGDALTVASCQQCQEPLRATMGRRPAYCSGKCRQKAYRARRKAEAMNEARRFPEAMREARRWVRCVVTADGRKMPVGKDGRALSWNRPEAWMTWMAAMNSTHGEALGFVLGAGFGCIDLDDCIREDGSLTPMARRVLDRNPECFVEVSNSGRGLHLFGALEESAAVVEKGFEVYSRGRFMLVTGDVFRAGEGWCDLRV